MNYKKYLGIAAVYVLLLATFAALSNGRLNVTTDSAYDWQSSTPQHQSLNPADALVRWDAYHYKGIAENGYSYKPGELNNIAFFPLYPMVIRAFTYIGVPFVAAALLINIVSLASVLYIFERLIKKFYPKIDHRMALAFGALFPLAIFFAAPYTESLFLALTLGAVYAFKLRRFGLGTILAVLCGLCRLNGILVLIVAAFEVYKNKDPILAKIKTLAVISIPVVLAPFSYLLYLRIKFGSFGIYGATQLSWGRKFLTINTSHFAVHTPSGVTNLIFDLSIIALGLGLVWLVYKRVDHGLALYSLVGILVPLSSGTTMSIGRYLLPIFPLWLGFASIKNRNLKYIFLVWSTMSMALVASIYSTGQWAG
jgi:hypothetical protein